MTTIRDHIPPPSPESQQAIQRALALLLTHAPKPAPKKTA